MKVYPSVEEKQRWLPRCAACEGGTERLMYSYPAMFRYAILALTTATTVSSTHKSSQRTKTQTSPIENEIRNDQLTVKQYTRVQASVKHIAGFNGITHIYCSKSPNEPNIIFRNEKTLTQKSGQASQTKHRSQRGSTTELIL